MDDLLRIYIKAAIQDKTEAALEEFDRAIDRDMGDDKIKSAAAEYGRRRKMENAFSQLCEKLPEASS